MPWPQLVPPLHVRVAPTTRLTHARESTTLPAMLGELGLQSAERTAPAAYWAVWAGHLR